MPILLTEHESSKGLLPRTETVTTDALWRVLFQRGREKPQPEYRSQASGKSNRRFQRWFRTGDYQIGVGSLEIRCFDLEAGRVTSVMRSSQCKASFTQQLAVTAAIGIQ